MSKDKELSVDVKTVLHGEVLGPKEDAAPLHSDIKGQKATMIMDDPLFQDSYERMAQHQRYQQQQYSSFQNQYQYMGNMMDITGRGFQTSSQLKLQYPHKKPWSLVDFLFR